jgi:hypothetical protein
VEDEPVGGSRLGMTRRVGEASTTLEFCVIRGRPQVPFRPPENLRAPVTIRTGLGAPTRSDGG